MAKEGDPAESYYLEKQGPPCDRDILWFQKTNALGAWFY